MDGAILFLICAVCYSIYKTNELENQIDGLREDIEEIRAFLNL